MISRSALPTAVTGAPLYLISPKSKVRIGLEVSFGETLNLRSGLHSSWLGCLHVHPHRIVLQMLWT
jgi:hypothetical protein